MCRSPSERARLRLSVVLPEPEQPTTAMRLMPDPSIAVSLPGGRTRAQLQDRARDRETVRVRNVHFELRTIDVDRQAELCVRFRRDSYVCSFGSDASFDEQFGGDAGYLAWLHERATREPACALHPWPGDQAIGQVELRIQPGTG